MSETYQYLFGPVPSRRLGRSLGVDLIPFKTCTMDCIYCQLGGTPCRSRERAEYVPMAEVLAELERWAAGEGQADHITLAGTGEPTLHLHFGDVFRWVKRETDLASVLLTNGSLLYLPEVRADAALADKVKVTLSAWDEASFQKLHRPAPGITFERLVEGERAFRREFAGELSVEVFVVEGVNSGKAQTEKIAEIIASVGPDHIDINTAVRPPADSGVHAVPMEELQALAEVFGPKARVAAAFGKRASPESELTSGALLKLIRRHPVAAEQLAGEFKVSAEALSGMLDTLTAEGRIHAEERGGTIYYFHRGPD